MFLLSLVNSGDGMGKENPTYLKPCCKCLDGCLKQMFVLKENKKTPKNKQTKNQTQKKNHKKNPKQNPKQTNKKKAPQRYFSFIKSYIKKPKILPGVFGVLLAERIVPNQTYLLLFLCWGFISVIRSFISLPPLMSELLCSLSPFFARSESLQITPRMPRRHISKRGIFQFFFDSPE